MKRILAIILTLAMLSAMLTVPTFAVDVNPQSSEHPVEIPAQGQTGRTEVRNGKIYDVVTYNGINYLVVRTVDQFLAMDDAGTVGTEYSPAYSANFILASDLDFSGVNLAPYNSTNPYQVAVIRGADEGGGVFKLHNFFLEGNGYSLNNMTLNFGIQGAGLFPSATWRTHTINNLTINATCNFTADKCGVLFGYTANGVQSNGEFNGAVITVNGVTLNANYNATGNQCGGFVGHSQMGLRFFNCNLNGDFTFAGGKSGGFVGYVTQYYMDVVFTMCNATGNYCFTNGTQCAVYVGMIENQWLPIGVYWSGCTADVDILKIAEDSIGIYVGMMWTYEGILQLSDCTSSGTYIDISENRKGRGWATAFISCVGGGRPAEVLFYNCDTDMLIMSELDIGGYVASTKSDSQVRFFFDYGCDNNAKILCGSFGKAWVCDIWDGGMVFDANSTAKNSVVISSLTHDPYNGELAYALAEAQKEYGIPEEYYFGQTIGVDARAKIGGDVVYKVDPLKSDAFYSNDIKGVDVIKAEVGNATAYTQVAQNGDKLLNRIIITVNEEKLASVANLEITLDYTLKDGTTKTFKLNNHQVDCYYSVYAGDMVAESEEGFVLLAITVKNIPAAQWDGESVVVSMIATDAEGNYLPEYMITYE